MTVSQWLYSKIQILQAVLHSHVGMCHIDGISVNTVSLQLHSADGNFLFIFIITHILPNFGLTLESSGAMKSFGLKKNWSFFNQVSKQFALKLI